MSLPTEQVLALASVVYFSASMLGVEYEGSLWS